MRVLLVGVGGLGCPASLALARGGVDQLTLVDPDCVELSNLHRQLWSRTPDIGRPKVQVAAERLSEAFPRLRLTALRERVDAGNVLGLFRAHQVVVDGTDGVGAKFMLSDAAVSTGVPLVYGGVIGLRGQAMRIAPGGACLRCLFEEPDPDSVPSCAQAGVLGPLAGLIGGLQALLVSPGAPAGVLHMIDGRSLWPRSLTVRRAPDCPACGHAQGPALAPRQAGGLVCPS